MGNSGLPVYTQVTYAGFSRFSVPTAQERNSHCHSYKIRLTN